MLGKGIGVCCAFVLVGAVSAGPQVKINNTNAWGQSVNGGPFEITPIGFAPVGSGLHGAATGRYITFCVERNEFLSQGSTYDVAFNTSAVNGGVGGGSPDPLDAKTAYLYTNFMNGTLSSLESTFTYNSAAGGDALQNAIWFIEQEITSLANGSIADKLFQLAKTQVDNGAWTGIGNVRVLNLTSGATNKQDLLVIIPLPSAAGLGVFGLGLVAVRRRR
jgi:hypothetical protein